MRVGRSRAMWAMGAATALAAVVGVWLMFRDAGTPTAPAAPGDEPAVSTATEPPPAPTAEATRPPDIPADPRIDYVLDLNPAEQHVFAMAWEGETLWFVGSELNGRITINRLELGSTEPHQWELPGKGSSGPYTYIAPGPNGELWVAADYGLWRFDPSAADTTVAVELERQSHWQTDGAFEQSTPLPGTWINGLVTVDGTTFLTRNNVQALFRVQGNGELEIVNELSYAPDGLTVVRGHPFPYATLGEATAAALGTDDRGHDAIALSDSPICRVSLDSARGTVEILGPAFERTLEDLLVAPGDAVAVSDAGEVFAIVLNEEATILRGGCVEDNIETFQLPVAYVSANDDPVRGGYFFEQQYGDREVRALVPVLAVAVSPTGAVAFSDGAQRVGIIR